MLFNRVLRLNELFEPDMPSKFIHSKFNRNENMAEENMVNESMIVMLCTSLYIWMKKLNEYRDIISHRMAFHYRIENTIRHDSSIKNDMYPSNCHWKLPKVS